MLEVLCGNKNIQRILIFLFVNGKCYGTQLHRSFGVPLTPVQKALSRLENGGLILSYHEGKTRLYRFNPAYPLLEELEQLLKKAYTLLPAEEKKRYYVLKQESFAPRVLQETPSQILLTLWKRLSQVSGLTFLARTKSKEASGWDGKGKGEVVVIKEGDRKLIFQEKGSWQNAQGQEVGFTNVFRWTLDIMAGVISLEHLRRGPDSPVFLFHLAPSGKHSLSSIDAHLCGPDTYFGQLHCEHHQMRLNWRVIGLKKNEEIDYFYD